MDIIWTLVIIIVILWLLGVVASIGGSLIHILLVIALILIILRLLGVVVL